MAGHSKWANIKHRKQSVDAKKALVYAQLSKEISVAARLGGTDPSYNFRLRNAIDRAKAVSMPSDNIQRAIDKFSSQKDNIEEILYEGYGPNGIAMLVEAATNNRNRTAAELRSIFGKYSGNLGESGCVSWSFKRYGVIYIPHEADSNEEQILEDLDKMEINPDDFDFEGDPENYLIFTLVESFEASINKLKSTYSNCSGELGYIPTNTIVIQDEEVVNNMEKLIELLENNEDTQKVFHNAILPES